MLIRICLGVVLALAQGLASADEKVELQKLSLEAREALALTNFAKIEALHAQSRAQPLTPSAYARSSVLIEVLDKSSTIVSVPAEKGLQHMQTVGENWRAAFPASSLAAYLRSQVQLNRAMDVRGLIPAKAVQTATWASFDAYVQKAADSLQQASNTVPQDEIWHTAVLKAARYQRLDTAAVKRLVEAGTDRFPEFLPIYHAAAWRLGPGGGGSAEDLEWLANLAVQKSSRRGSLLPYAMIYAELGRTSLHDSLFDVTAVDWKKMRAGFEELVASHPDASNLNNFAWFACVARDQATFASLVTRLGGQPDAARWGDPAAYSACMRFAQAPPSGPGSEVVTTRAQFRSMLRDNDFEGIEKTYAQLVATKARNESGNPPADLFADYSGAACSSGSTYIRTSALGTPLERESAAVSDARTAACRQRVEDKMLAWRNRFPNSSLAAAGLSDIYLRATDVQPSPPVSVLDAAFERGQAVLQMVPVAKRDLQWYLQHLWVGSLQGWSPVRYKRVLAEAMVNHPDSPMLYKRAVAHFLPGNGGSFAEIDQVARMGLARNDDIPAGLLMYARVYDEVAFGSGNYQDAAYSRTQIQWPEMLAGLNEMRRRYPGPWTDNRTANHACLAGEVDTLRSMLARTRSTQLRDHGWAAGWRAFCIHWLDTHDKREKGPAKPNT